MIVLKSREEVEKLRAANRIVAETMVKLGELVSPGITTGELDRIAQEYIISRGGKSAFPMVPGYKHTLCVSIDEEVVHGIPGKRRLEEGSIVSIDCGVFLDGFYGDHAWTFPVGKISEEKAELLRVAEESLNLGIKKAVAGGRLYDISAAVQGCAESAGFSVVRDYVGHGIGKGLHEEPQVPNFGSAGSGLKLRRGLVIALEPMVNIGSYEVETLDDGWTVVTKDRKPSAHFEHSIAIMENGPEILSLI